MPQRRFAATFGRTCPPWPDETSPRVLVEALVPVFELPPLQRIHGIVISVEQVRSTLNATTDPGRDAIELAGAIEGWTAERLTAP